MPEDIIFCIDMQHNYASAFRDGQAGFEAACSKVGAFSEAALQRGIPTWTFYYHFGPQTGGEKDIPCQLGSPAFLKHSSSAFDKPELLPELRKEGVKKIYIMGCYMNDCLVATAIDAVLHDYETVIVQNLAFDQSSKTPVHASWTEEQIRRCIHLRFHGKIRADMSVYALSDNSRHLYNMARKQVKPIASLAEYELIKDMCGPSVMDVAQLYDRQCLGFGNLAAKFGKLKAVHDMKMSGHPDYLATLTIGIKKTEDILKEYPRRVSGNLPVLSARPT